MLTIFKNFNNCSLKCILQVVCILNIIAIVKCLIIDNYVILCSPLISVIFDLKGVFWRLWRNFKFSPMSLVWRWFISKSNWTECAVCTKCFYVSVYAGLSKWPLCAQISRVKLLCPSYVPHAHWILRQNIYVFFTLIWFSHPMTHSFRLFVSFTWHSLIP